VRPRTLEGAVELLPDANVAIVSVPGDLAALETHKALSAGMHVLLFSDNIDVATEAELRSAPSSWACWSWARERNGDARRHRSGLRERRASRSDRILAAAGTGAQEVMSLIARWGSGVAEAIGIGGRDLSEPVGGKMAALGLRALTRTPRSRWWWWCPNRLRPRSRPGSPSSSDPSPPWSP
jgi:FdrA protein